LTLAEIAGWLGRTADQAKYTAKANKLKTAINALMFSGKAFCDGICRTQNRAATYGPKWCPKLALHRALYRALNR